MQYLVLLMAVGFLGCGSPTEPSDCIVTTMPVQNTVSGDTVAIATVTFCNGAKPA